MFFRQFFEPISCTYTYLLADLDKREAIIIDPVFEKLALYLKLINEYGIQLALAIDTHTHADHVTATGKLRENTDCAIVMGKQSKAECVTVRVKEGDKVKVGNLELEAIFTPGHTDDHYCFKYKDRVFTGDTLLIRATGRTDFQNGDPYAQYDSLFNKLLKLPDDFLVYPAHNYTGMTVSTIAEEKQFNPRLQVENEQQYADIMNNLNLAMPRMIDIAVPENVKCGLEYQPE